MDATTTPARPVAQAPTHHRRFPPQPIDPASRMRRIKIARAVNLICRTKCSVAVALRACGLDRDHNAREDVCYLLDRRSIPRIRLGVRRVRFPETPSRNFEEFIPRQEGHRRATGVAEMLEELKAVANPLREDVPRAPKPRVICACTVCGTIFESKQRRARCCGGACRIAHWRAEQ
jgi:hypothetical protein